MQEIYLITLAILGWMLTLYFGYFRLRQYQWTRHKVESDLFIKLNQRNEQLFLKLCNLASLRAKNEQLGIKFRAAQHAYFQLWQEKLLLLESEIVPPKMSSFWLNGFTNEVAIIFHHYPLLQAEWMTTPVFLQLQNSLGKYQEAGRPEKTTVSDLPALMRPFNQLMQTQ